VGASVPGLLDGTPRRVGIVAVALGSLLAFVLVNANASASVRRFVTLLGPKSHTTSFARSYGFEMLAAYYQSVGDPGKALHYSRLMLEAEPSNPRHWAKVGTSLFNARQYDAAIPFLETSLRGDPARVGTRTNLGICYASVGRFADAADQFVVVKLSPDQPEPRHNLALALAKADSLDAANAVWKDLLARWPDYAPAKIAAQKYLHAEDRR
jgi:tetratricopeptide (TPR) repeat protein